MSERLKIELDSLPLQTVRAHGGEGLIGFRRILHGEEQEGSWNFVDFAEIPPGASIGRHRHGEDEELYLVLDGEGTMHRDGEDFAVRRGSVVLNGRGGTHGLVNTGNCPLRIFVVEVPVRRSRDGD